jgi:hypothetical protein
MQQKQIKLTAAFMLCIGVGMVQAQEAVLTTGGDAVGTGGSVSYSIGQVSYTSAFSTGNSVSEGVQQPYEISTVTAITESGINLEMLVYPNPTVSGVKLSVPQNSENLSCQLVDISGKLILQQNITAGNTNLVMDKLSNGTYLLNVYQNQSVVKTFRVIKN